MIKVEKHWYTFTAILRLITWTNSDIMMKWGVYVCVWIHTYTHTPLANSEEETGSTLAICTVSELARTRCCIFYYMVKVNLNLLEVKVRLSSLNITISEIIETYSALPISLWLKKRSHKLDNSCSLILYISLAFLNLMTSRCIGFQLYKFLPGKF